MCIPFYAMARRLVSAVRCLIAVRGNCRQAEIGLLETPGPTKGPICQRDISPPKGRGDMRPRYRAADRSPGTSNDAQIPRRPLFGDLTFPWEQSERKSHVPRQPVVTSQPRASLANARNVSRCFVVKLERRQRSTRSPGSRPVGDHCQTQ